MGWVETLPGKIVALDTAPLIYAMEGDPVRAAKVRPLFDAAFRGDLTILTSVVTLVEVLTRPMKLKRADLIESYRDLLLHAEGFVIVDTTKDIAEQAARFRSEHNLKTPDAIQLATALHAKAECFVTNDQQFPAVAGNLRVIHLDDPAIR